MAQELKAGDIAPPFELARDGTGSLSLAALATQNTVLYFYPRDDTSGCTQEAIDFNGMKAEFHEAGAQVVGISPDSIKSHDKFKAKHGLDMILLADESTAMLEAYGVWVEKSMYGRKYMGVERTTMLIGRDGKIIRIWNKVKVPGHAREVLEAAQAV